MQKATYTICILRNLHEGGSYVSYVVNLAKTEHIRSLVHHLLGAIEH